MEDLTDEQLLSCPEVIEPTFIHRGRRDSISAQSGKEKQKNRPKCSPIFPNVPNIFQKVFQL